MARVTLLFDRDDVERAPLDGGTFLALTPAAEAEALSRSMEVLLVGLSDQVHTECVTFAERVLSDLSGSVMSALSPSLRVMARQSVWALAFLVHRVRRSLPNGPWRVRCGGGHWQMVSERRALMDLLLPRVWNYGLAHRVPAAAPPWASLHRWLTRRAAGRLRRSGRSWVIAPTRKLRSGLREALEHDGVGVLVLQPTIGCWSDYRGLMRAPTAADDAWVLSVSPLSRCDVRVPEASARLRALCASLKDADLSRAWDRYVEQCEALLPAVLAAASDTEALVRASSVRAAVAFEANAWWSAALLDGAGRAGVRRAVFNHNSHPPGAGAVADELLGRLFAHRTCNELVDDAGIWSPSAMQWAERYQMGERNTRLQPVRLDYPTLVPQFGANRAFRVLHAGNYQNWSDFFPLVAETSGEYLKGMERLADAVSGLEGVELTFRVRPKREVDAAALRARLRSQANVLVCDTEENFLGQLAKCDLLVSHFSTTVEQALQMGKPVLLWGSTQRYSQFPGRETLPSPNSRAAVYVVRRAEALPAMLAAIRAAHSGRPLTDAECEPYRHPEGTFNIIQWIRRVLSTPSPPLTHRA